MILTLKIIAATLVVVGILVGYISMTREPHALLLERAPKRPSWLPWLAWALSSVSALVYVALDILQITTNRP